MIKAVSFLSSSLKSGGAEKVIFELASEAAKLGMKTELILLTNQAKFFKPSSSIILHEPEFTIQELGRIRYQWKLFWWLRGKVRKSESKAFLSFGGKYNAFVILSSLGLKKDIFISDRSRPSISYGKFLDFVNPIVYRQAKGIIAQTEIAKQRAFTKTKHPNIKVIGNPIPQISSLREERKPRVLNVGRFIASKHQDWLVNYFSEIKANDWELHFYGDGQYWDDVQSHSKNTKAKIFFHGNVHDIEQVYQSSSVFAFTSTSEGFPNALGEAMSAGCACISFDCEAGPSDLIDDGINGFLVREEDHTTYKEKLNILLKNQELREQFGLKATQKIKDHFAVETVAMEYLQFMLGENSH